MPKTANPVRVSLARIANILDAVKNGEMVGITFTRRTPKCHDCKRSLKSFVGKTHCHMCGGVLETVSSVVAQKGVKNPKNLLAKANNAQTLKSNYNLFAYYNSKTENPDGSKGGYRSCGYPQILEVRTKGKEYVV